MMLVCSLVACSSDNYAPVMDFASIEHIPKDGLYRVSPNETLYSIAWRYGLDYRYLANLNHIAPPYHVFAGQRLYLKGKLKKVPPHATTSPAKSAPIMIVPHEKNILVRTWNWPAKGPVIGLYSSHNKGINIGGQEGNPVFATAAGLIVYSGNRLRGYGNLIIIKHNSTYLTAYAHNSAVSVKEGDWVRAGQKIAEMGDTGASRVMLHFEIRRNGQPVNPLNYLVR
jgi:lipoprotein NlpD